MHGCGRWFGIGKWRCNRKCNQKFLARLTHWCEECKDEHGRPRSRPFFVRNPSSTPMHPDSANAYPSGNTASIWMGTFEVPDLPPLARDLTTDVCVIGAGIAGLS